MYSLKLLSSSKGLLKTIGSDTFTEQLGVTFSLAIDRNDPQTGPLYNDPRYYNCGPARCPAPPSVPRAINDSTVTLSATQHEYNSSVQSVSVSSVTLCGKTLTVNEKEVGLEWSSTTPLTFTGSSQSPTATATGTVNNDELGVTVTGAQTNAGENYTATASGLTGDKAGNRCWDGLYWPLRRAVQEHG